MTIPRIQQIASVVVVVLLIIVLFVPLPSCSKEALVDKPAIVKHEQDAKAEDQGSTEQTLLNKKIMVDVKGAVKRPGPYSFKLGDRIKDAVVRAELTQAADVTEMNLAARLIDGQEVIVPTKEKVKLAQPKEEVPQADAPTGLVDLNAATEQQLLEVPGIGPAKASAILAYREEKGGFARYEDLGEVKGFGDKTLETLRAYLIVY
ncbi:helix-hairpin-helix domain-containing protein [Exiguobacterium oxidotolerans]|uniref:Competence protein ComEA n=1 Tax=Exiguobacterium oxidotolerans TaxID=223958 RepID=A0A653IG65_9BACL|nr:helix-hairpin-helix domain-containing protein [Exiguobacterium oxidotolerans]VWX38091.1 Competence protein ComEA [Exiguobacterium oxidotolerans]